jgi:hypothetical protein
MERHLLYRQTQRLPMNAEHHAEAQERLTRKRR